MVVRLIHSMAGEKFLESKKKYNMLCPGEGGEEEKMTKWIKWLKKGGGGEGGSRV
jgi:prephenate dehydrogenase